MSEFDHALKKVQDAADGGIGAHSTGEALMAALCLDRPDWLAKMGYTIAQALDRVGQEWCAMIPEISRRVSRHREDLAESKRIADQAVALAAASASGAGGQDFIDCAAKLVTTGSAPGYRDPSFRFDLEPLGSRTPLRVALRLRPEDGEPVVRHILEVHAFAWERGRPLDIQEGESRPRWIDAKL